MKITIEGIVPFEVCINCSSFGKQNPEVYSCQVY
ncbi:hypothetical protein TNCV_1143431 [Trichonephila clavipes]|nr:hypothetical protein TNCV_1143431 [Trichonephila clavipes]